DVEVDVAAGEALTGGARLAALAGDEPVRFPRAHAQRAGHRQSHDLEAPAARIACRPQPLPGVEGNRVLRIAALLAPGEAHHSRAGEARKIVDVAVGLVVEYALPQPDDLLDP